MKKNNIIKAIAIALLLGGFVSATAKITDLKSANAHLSKAAIEFNAIAAKKSRVLKIAPANEFITKTNDAIKEIKAIHIADFTSDHGRAKENERGAIVTVLESYITALQEQIKS